MKSSVHTQENQNNKFNSGGNNNHGQGLKQEV